MAIFSHYGSAPHPLAMVARSPSTTALSPEQRANASIIAHLFTAAGWGPEMAAAAIASAWAESRLHSEIWGDKSSRPEGCSGGLFQLNRCAGAGMGMTRADIEDPALNTRRILEEVAGSFGRPLRTAWARGERNVGTLTAFFTTSILRPGNAAERALQRAADAHVMFPPAALAAASPVGHREGSMDAGAGRR